jgi:hypothetical protein
LKGRDRTTIFWIRYARLRRNSSSITDWPGYREMLIRHAGELISHGKDHGGAILAAKQRLMSGEDLRVSMRSGLSPANPRPHCGGDREG